MKLASKANFLKNIKTEKNMKHLLVLLIACLLSSSLAAQIPKLISYQGLLTNSSGQVLTDGNYNITVKIFDAATGGAELLPAPAIANDLVEVTKTYSAGNNVFDLDSRIMSVLFSRFGEDTAEDTSSGNIRIVGIVLEYLEE